MPDITDYNVLTDVAFTLDPGDKKDLMFTLPSDLPETHREILSWVMVGSSPPTARYTITLNGTEVTETGTPGEGYPTPPDPDRRALHEVIEKDVKVHPGGSNTLTVTNVSTSGTVRMSDIVFWFHKI